MPTPSPSVIADELAQAEAFVARLPSAPASRELRARLESYRRTVDGWTARKPSEDQVDAMRACIAEVLGIASTEAPTVRVKIPLDDHD